MIEYRNILDVTPEIQETVREWRNSIRVRQGMLDQSEISFEQHQKWLSSLKIKFPCRLVRIVFKDEIPFGVLNLGNIDWDVKTCDWGFFIGNQSFLGKRLGKRLVYDGSEWGFMEQGFHKLYSSVRSDNLSVLNMDMEGGSHIEGFLKNHMYDREGNLIGIYLIAQFRGEWLKQREKIAAWGKIGE